MEGSVRKETAGSLPALPLLPTAPGSGANPSVTSHHRPGLKQGVSEKAGMGAEQKAGDVGKGK